MKQNSFRISGAALFLSIAAALAIFRTWPELDLWVAGQFYSNGAGFDVLEDPFWLGTRYLLWDLSVLLCVSTLPLGIIAGVRKRTVLGFPARRWLFVFALYLLAPVLLVNGILKSLSGRARPADVTEFDGDRLFTAAGTFTDQCAHNCSFVSGEVSATVVLALALIMAGNSWRGSLPRWGLMSLRLLALLSAIFVGLQRMAQGRHFLSDVTLAALFTLAVAWILHGFFERGWHATLRAWFAGIGSPGKSG